MTAVAIGLVCLGLAFIIVSTVGLLRLPDLYTRTHAIAKSETLGLILVFGGMLFSPEMSWAVAIRLALVLIFSVLANPTAAHALVRAGHDSGIQPWTREAR